MSPFINSFRALCMCIWSMRRTYSTVRCSKCSAGHRRIHEHKHNSTPLYCRDTPPVSHLDACWWTRTHTLPTCYELVAFCHLSTWLPNRNQGSSVGLRSLAAEWQSLATEDGTHSSSNGSKNKEGPLIHVVVLNLLDSWSCRSPENLR
jgi:hypothetical protein